MPSAEVDEAPRGRGGGSAQPKYAGAVPDGARRPAEEGMVIQNGARVTISGLKARPDLNGRIGTVESLNEANGRFNVKVEKQVGTGFEMIALKPSALELVPQAPPVAKASSSSLAAPSADGERSVQVKCEGPDGKLILKLTLTSKQLKKGQGIDKAVVIPFLKGYSKKVKKDFGITDVHAVTVDGVELADITLPANIVLLPHKMVHLELTFPPPPPPPPFLGKHVAFTGLDTTAYRQDINGYWGKVESYDEVRGWYAVQVMGRRNNTVTVPPDKLLELVDKASLHKHDLRDLDEFDEFKHVTSIPKVGTTAYDIWLHGADRRKEEEADRSARGLLTRAFLTVPFHEKCCHIEQQLRKFLSEVHVVRANLSRDLQLKTRGNEILKTCHEDCKKSLLEIRQLYTRVDLAEKEAMERWNEDPATIEWRAKKKAFDRLQAERKLETFVGMKDDELDPDALRDAIEYAEGLNIDEELLEDAEDKLEDARDAAWAKIAAENAERDRLEKEEAAASRLAEAERAATERALAIAAAEKEWAERRAKGTARVDANGMAVPLPQYKVPKPPLFAAAEGFGGARTGCVFKCGAKGLGYYRDGVDDEAEEEEEEEEEEDEDDDDDEVLELEGNEEETEEEKAEKERLIEKKALEMAEAREDAERRQEEVEAEARAAQRRVDQAKRDAEREIQQRRELAAAAKRAAMLEAERDARMDIADRAAKCEMLELPTTATIADVKKRYRTLVKTIHPDRGGDAAHFELVQAAYDQLLLLGEPRLAPERLPDSQIDAAKEGAEDGPEGMPQMPPNMQLARVEELRARVDEAAELAEETSHADGALKYHMKKWKPPQHLQYWGDGDD